MTALQRRAAEMCVFTAVTWHIIAHDCHMTVTWLALLLSARCGTPGLGSPSLTQARHRRHLEACLSSLHTFLGGPLCVHILSACPQDSIHFMWPLCELTLLHVSFLRRSVQEWRATGVCSRGAETGHAVLGSHHGTSDCVRYTQCHF